MFAARPPSTVASGYANADVASGPVIARLLRSAPAGRDVALGNYAWYEALGFDIAAQLRTTGARAAVRPLTRPRA